MPEEERLASMHIVDVDGTVFSAGDAVIKMMSIMPATQEQAALAAQDPAMRAEIARQYQELADRRGELSEQVPDVEPIAVRPRWVNLPD